MNGAMNEDSLVAWIKKHAAAPLTRDVVLGIGDDCAILRPRKGEELLLKTDPVIEGVHFTTLCRRSRGSPSARAKFERHRGHGGVASVLSGVAGFGAHHDETWIKDFFRGLLGLAKKTGTVLVGGDLAKSPHETHVNVMLCGAVPSG